MLSAFFNFLMILLACIYIPAGILIPLVYNNQNLDKSEKAKFLFFLIIVWILFPLILLTVKSPSQLYFYSSIIIGFSVMSFSFSLFAIEYLENKR